MAEVGRDLWKASCPTPLLKQGHLEPAAQDHVQKAFGYFQGGRLHSLPGQPVPVLGHPHSIKKCFLKFRRTSRVSVCAHCLWSWHWAPLERTWLCPLYTLPSGIYTH